MPEPTIEVNYEVLASKASELERVKAGLDAWRHGTQITGRFASVGDSDLEEELKSFHGGWRDGVDEIEKNLEGAITLLKTASEQYRGADQSVADAAAKMGGAAPAAGGG
jgi:hypothetical protein